MERVVVHLNCYWSGNPLDFDLGGLVLRCQKFSRGLDAALELAGRINFWKRFEHQPKVWREARGDAVCSLDNAL